MIASAYSRQMDLLVGEPSCCYSLCGAGSSEKVGSADDVSVPSSDLGLSSILIHLSL